MIIFVIISLSPAAIYVVDKGWERLPETELYLVSVDASLTPAIRVDGNICDVENTIRDGVNTAL